jgi:amino-acid N-acetyltransferase
MTLSDLRHPEIRLCAPEQRAAVLALLAACGLPDDGLEDHWESAWVAVDPGAGAGSVILGSVALEIRGSAALLRSLAIREDQRSRGLGSALFEFAMARAKDASVDTLALLTTTAEPFFTRRGFEAVSRESAPEALRASAEFRGACPASARLMVRRVR